MHAIPSTDTDTDTNNSAEHTQIVSPYVYVHYLNGVNFIFFPFFFSSKGKGRINWNLQLRNIISLDQVLYILLLNIRQTERERGREREKEGERERQPALALSMN